MESDNGKCSISVRCPRQILHHQKYDLKKYVVAAVLSDGTRVELLATCASFSEEETKLLVELPPQIDAAEGELCVSALYGRDEGLSVSSKPHKIDNWPVYGKGTFNFICRGQYVLTLNVCHKIEEIIAVWFIIKKS